ncbi:MAG: hypothetical protein ABIP19_09285 [Dermatophilaceae bacterium]
MGLFTRKAPRPELPRAVLKALELAKGERVLAFAADGNTGAHVVATTYALAVVSSTPMTSAVTSPEPASPALTSPLVALTAERTLRRRWLSVDAGAWEPETATLTVTWADGRRAGQWSFRDQSTLLPETVRERVQTSVVISTRLTLGDRRSGRVAIRQDFATGELIPQTILGRYTRADDPEVQAHVDAALAHLRDQVGLPA